MTGDASDLYSELSEAREQLAALEESDADPEEIEAAREWVEFLERERDRVGPDPFETCLAEHAQRASMETAEKRKTKGPLARVRKLF